MAKDRIQKLPPKAPPTLDVILNKEQEDGYKLLKNSVLTYIDGKAGSGKTMLAIYAALSALHANEINTVYITRPYVTAKEDMGFLPGDIKEKMDPMMIPIYDNLMKVYSVRNQKTGVSKITQYMEDGDLEIAPISFMRGRTFDYSYVILDEAQNITADQLKMAMTRIGKNTKMIICGDLDQCDLYKSNSSGVYLLKQLIERGNIEFLSSVYLKENHRDPIVAKLMDEFDAIEHGK